MSRQPPSLLHALRRGFTLTAVGLLLWTYFFTRDYQVIVNRLLPATWLMAGFAAAGCFIMFAGYRDWRQTRDALLEDEREERERQTTMKP